MIPRFLFALRDAASSLTASKLLDMRQRLADEKIARRRIGNRLVSVQSELDHLRIRFEDMHKVLEQYVVSVRTASADENLLAAGFVRLAVELQEAVSYRGALSSLVDTLSEDVGQLRGELREALVEKERLLNMLRPAWGDGVGRALAIRAFAHRLPCRVIEGEAGPYLSRYTLAEMPDGGHVYLHFFHRGDIDRTLHNHPWAGTSVILTGGYIEERRGEGDRIDVRTYGPGDVNHLAPDTFHRVDLLDDRGCWTLFITSARVQSWGFWCRDSKVFTPWREALAARGLAPVPSISEKGSDDV